VTVTVRPAHTDELPRVGELTVEAYEHDALLVEDDAYAASLRDAVTRAREAELYVAVLTDLLAHPDDPGEAVGTVTFCPQGSPWAELAQPGEGEFRMLAVDPSVRRRGVAQALVGLCLERSRELGYTAVVLSSLPVQEPAHRIYERLGFRRTPDLDWSPAAGVDLLAFRCEL
jgi:ribosomal protein S18 acetylase RimI-like enzyme